MTTTGHCTLRMMSQIPTPHNEVGLIVLAVIVVSPNSLGLPSGRLFGTVTAERISDGLQTLALGVNAHEQSDETTGKHDAGTDEVTADKGPREEPSPMRLPKMNGAIAPAIWAIEKK